MEIILIKKFERHFVSTKLFLFSIHMFGTKINFMDNYLFPSNILCLRTIFSFIIIVVVILPLYFIEKQYFIHVVREIIKNVLVYRNSGRSSLIYYTLAYYKHGERRT